MLTLTDRAAEVIRELTHQPDVPDDTGLRIAPEPQGAGSLTVQLTAEPESGDEVITESGARVFLEPAAAIALDDKILDAEVSGGGSVSFTLGEQA